MKSSSAGKKAFQFLYEEFSSSKFRKKQIQMLYKALTGNLVNSKKHQLSYLLAQSLVEKYSTKKNLLDQIHKDFEIRNLFLKFINTSLQEIELHPNFINRFAYKICNLYQQEKIQMTQRQLRSNQEAIENIWSPQQLTFVSCLCSKFSDKKMVEEKEQQCYKCARMFHPACFWDKQRDQVYQCPFCYLQYSMPQKQIKQVIFAGYIPKVKRQRLQYKINFSINQKIKADKTLYIQARCAKFNSKNRYEISWPDNGLITLNKMKIQQFRPLQMNSPLKRRPDEPIKFQKTRLFPQNQIILQQKMFSDYNNRHIQIDYHLVIIAVVRDITKQNLMLKLQKNLLTCQSSKQTLKQYFTGHSESQIDIQQISISLRCQFFSSRIRKPSRSVQCSTHYQVFDLQNFIVSSISAKSSTKKWKCPICDRRSYDLIVDGYILDIMEKGKNIMEVKFGSDCQPIYVENQEDDQDQQIRQGYKQKDKIIAEQVNIEDKCCVIDLDSENNEHELIENQHSDLFNRAVDNQPVIENIRQDIPQNSNADKSTRNQNKDNDVEPPKRNRQIPQSQKNLGQNIRKMRQTQLNKNNTIDLLQISSEEQVQTNEKSKVNKIRWSADHLRPASTQMKQYAQSLVNKQKQKKLWQSPEIIIQKSQVSKKQTISKLNADIIEKKDQNQLKSKKPKQKSIIDNNNSIIEIESGNQEEQIEQKNSEHVNSKNKVKKVEKVKDIKKLKDLYEKLEYAHRLISSQVDATASSVTDDDHQIFEGIYEKIAAMDKNKI